MYGCFCAGSVCTEAAMITRNCKNCLFHICPYVSEEQLSGYGGNKLLEVNGSKYATSSKCFSLSAFTEGMCKYDAEGKSLLEESVGVPYDVPALACPGTEEDYLFDSSNPLYDVSSMISAEVSRIMTPSLLKSAL